MIRYFPWGDVSQKLHNKFDWDRIVLTNAVNVDSVIVDCGFYEIISTKAFVEMLYIQSKYWKSWRGIAEQQKMFWMLP